MALVPYRKESWWVDPFAEMENIQKEMNRLFNFSLARHPWGENTLLGGQWAPAVDIYDSKDQILVKADLPGLNKDEIEVSVEEGSLVIKGEKKRDTEVNEENQYKTERFYGSFYRTIPLSSKVDAEKVNAKYQDGVLTLTLSKKEEERPKQIKVDIK